MRTVSPLELAQKGTRGNSRPLCETAPWELGASPACTSKEMVGSSTVGKLRAQKLASSMPHPVIPYFGVAVWAIPCSPQKLAARQQGERMGS
jgi:hypothetical protein